MHKIRGKVLHGAKRGRKLGYPTANLLLKKPIPQGIYLSITTLSKKNYPSLTFIGNATTFNESKVQAEVYILSFARNIYDKWIKVSLIKKIRDNRKFSSVEELKNKMKLDEKIAREYFAM